MLFSSLFVSAQLSEDDLARHIGPGLFFYVVGCILAFAGCVLGIRQCRGVEDAA